jgi:hypothetical protein
MYPFRRRLSAAADLPTLYPVGRDSSARPVTSAAQRVPFPGMRKFLITPRRHAIVQPKPLAIRSAVVS